MPYSAISDKDARLAQQCAQSLANLGSLGEVLKVGALNVLNVGRIIEHNQPAQSEEGDGEGVDG